MKIPDGSIYRFRPKLPTAEPAPVRNISKHIAVDEGNGNDIAQFVELHKQLGTMHRDVSKKDGQLRRNAKPVHNDRKRSSRSTCK